jgi:hypothetical protein
MFRFIIVAALVAAFFPAGRARAATAEGALLTNVATATFWSLQGTPLLPEWNGTAYVLVVAPSIQVSKTADPWIECPGATVTFCIYAVNESLYTSAFNVILNDRLPDLFAYVSGQDRWAGNTSGATITPGYRGPGGFDVYCWPGVIHASCPDGAPSSGEPNDGQIGPNYNVRWAISVIGPGQSAMACFKVRIL